MTKNIELLAPAGNAAALRAAVSAGADAVYLGLESFNARRGADNFTVRTFEEACAYAHLRGVRVYVTMNTAVLPAEVDEALECARQAYRAGADAFIVQDIGLASEISRTLPEARLHISTQMNTHNEAGLRAAQAYRAGADAFIVQDIGLASEISRTLPEARLHISTQMNTHNEAGLRAAARLGASRVTLARELSLEEIAHLSEVAASLGMEVEAFAHGALCVCYSGQCFMSSLIGGRSANRGMCAQACRLPYELRNASLRSKSLPSPGEHLLSPRDLCSIDLLSELVDGGVSSLKIEGRMKSPDYVYSVVSVYRAVLDRVLAACDADGVEAERVSATDEEREKLASAFSRDYVYSVVSVYRAVLDRVLAACDADGVEAERVSATDEEREKLASAFSRGFTTAYLEGERGNDIMSYQRPNNRGQFVGRVAEVKRGEAKIATETEIVVGDVIEFWTKRGHTALTVTAVATAKGGAAVSVPLDEKTRIATETEIVVGDVIEFWTKRGHTALTVTAVATAKGGAAVSVPLDEKTRSVRAGDRVFRVRSVAAAFSDDELEPRVPLVGKATLRIGSPLRIEFALAGAGVCSDAVDARIAARLERLFDGRAPRGIAEGDAIEPARTRPVAADDVYAHVDRLGSTPFTLVGFDVDLDEGVGIGFSQIHRCRAEALDALEQRMLAGTSERSLPRIADDRVVYERPRASCVVAAWASNPVCARAAKRAGAEVVYVSERSLPRIADDRVVYERPRASCVVAAWASNPVCARAAKRAGAEVVYVPALNFRRGEAVIAGQLMGRAEQAGFPKHCTPALPVVDHGAIGRSREHAVDVDVWRYVSAGSPVLVENLAAQAPRSSTSPLLTFGGARPSSRDSLWVVPSKRAFRSTARRLCPSSTTGRSVVRASMRSMSTSGVTYPPAARFSSRIWRGFSEPRRRTPCPRSGRMCL